MCYTTNSNGKMDNHKYILDRTENKVLLNFFKTKVMGHGKDFLANDGNIN